MQIGDNISNVVRPMAGCRNLVGGIVAGLIFMVVGAGMFYLMGDRVQDALQSRSWPTVEGKVASSRLVSETDSDGDSMYRADVTYRYTIDGRDYTGRSVGLMDGSTSVRGSVQRTVDSYPVGEPVTVYYKPDDPAFAVLKPGFTFGVIALGGLMTCFPMIGLITILGSIAQVFRLGR